MNTIRLLQLEQPATFERPLTRPCSVDREGVLSVSYVCRVSANGVRSGPDTVGGAARIKAENRKRRRENVTRGIVFAQGTTRKVYSVIKEVLEIRARAVPGGGRQLKNPRERREEAELGSPR